MWKNWHMNYDVYFVFNFNVPQSSTGIQDHQYKIYNYLVMMTLVKGGSFLIFNNPILSMFNKSHATFVSFSTGHRTTISDKDMLYVIRLCNLSPWKQKWRQGLPSQHIVYILQDFKFRYCLMILYFKLIVFVYCTCLPIKTGNDCLITGMWYGTICFDIWNVNV